MIVDFRSDNVAAVCPEVMDALVRANALGPVASYGDDPLTAELEQRLAAVFEHDVAVVPLATGTAANALALACLAQPWQGVLCQSVAHVYTDECGAGEFYTGGAKLYPLPVTLNKVSPADVRAEHARWSGRHPHFQPPVALTITQATEFGTLYSLEELATLGATTRELGMTLHMDGARFANALVALGCTPAEMTWKRGVDALSFGATKNGAMAAEALIFFQPELAASAYHRRKRAGHLWSKQRFLAAQLLGYLQDDAWRRNARHANAMAARLAAGARAKGVEPMAPVQINEVFLALDEQRERRLRDAGVLFHAGGGRARFVTAWCTTAAEVDAMVAAL